MYIRVGVILLYMKYIWIITENVNLFHSRISLMLKFSTSAAYLYNDNIYTYINYIYVVSLYELSSSSSPTQFYSVQHIILNQEKENK